MHFGHVIGGSGLRGTHSCPQRMHSRFGSLITFAFIPVWYRWQAIESIPTSTHLRRKLAAGRTAARGIEPQKMQRPSLSREWSRRM